MEVVFVNIAAVVVVIVVVVVVGVVVVVDAKAGVGNGSIVLASVMAKNGQNMISDHIL